MYDYFINKGLITGLLAYTGVTVAYGLLIYYGTHQLLKSQIKKNHERIGRVVFRVSASLLALILSITFANQRVSYFRIIDSLQAEAANLVELHMDLGLYNTPEAKEIQSQIREYVAEISKSDWNQLFDDPFKSESFILFRKIYFNVFQLQASTPLQERLQEKILVEIAAISDYLQIRVYSTRPETNNLLYTTILGIAFCMIVFSVYPVDRVSIAFSSCYLAFVGIVLFFTIMMTSPLKGPLRIEAEPFKILQETIEKNYN